MIATFGKILLEHSLLNEANYWCRCGAVPHSAEEYVRHFEKVLEKAGIEIGVLNAS